MCCVWNSRLELENRIGQGLVKPSGLNHAHGLQIALEQQIEVVGMSRLEVGIAFGNRVAATRSTLAHQLKRREIREVGPRNASSVGRPEVGVSIKGVLNLYAWQEIRVSLFP